MINLLLQPSGPDLALRYSQAGAAPLSGTRGRRSADRQETVVIIVTGTILARPATVEEVVALSLTHVHRSRGEPGCLLHSVHRDVEDPLRLVFIENWADADALRAHFRVPASRAFVKEAAALAAEAPEISIYHAEIASP